MKNGNAGYLGTSTSFGRHYHVFQRLQDELRGETLRCLVIGPGVDGHKEPGVIHTYEPFELANAIHNAGLEFMIDVMDINPEVLHELEKRPAMLSIDRNFWGEGNGKPEDYITHQKSYYDGFFPQHVVSGNGHAKTVSLPDDIMSRFRPIQGDIVSDEIDKYDIVVCTEVLLSYKLPKGHKIADVRQKIIDSADRFLIATMYHVAGFVDLIQTPTRGVTDHDDSATLFRRM